MTVRTRAGHDHSMNENNGSGGKKLVRTRDGRLIAGVASGLAAYFGVDANLVRLGFAVLVVLLVISGH